MAKATYDDATKVAVMAALLTGQSAAAVAREYKLPPSTVRNWKQDAAKTGALPDSPERTNQRERIGELIIDNLEAALETTKVMLNAFANKDWLAKQEASQLAVLYGVISDKVFRVLEALPDGGGDGDQ